ncbi:hypothetical protein, partial [Actinoplanes sp. NPDC049265]|uniref:hypothetical protein n=1 Tax=Actinoplanes sp. NPDC049265 TaxID=3363902 RepID=UPI0037129F15
STMLAEYDFAAGTGEGPQALPPVGDLVSRLLTPPAPADVETDESSPMRFGPVQRVYTPAGLRLLHEDDAHYVAAFDALPPGADYRVGVHSHAHEVQAGRHLYSPETVAQQIVDDPKWTGQNITIIACEPSPTFVRKVFEQVRRLAPNRSGFSVTGGLGSVWTTPMGHIFVAKSTIADDGRIRAGRFLTGDSWVSYTEGPDGTVTETRHQQPHLPGTLAPTPEDIEAADNVWRLGFEVEVAVEIAVGSGRYGTIPHQTRIATSDYFNFVTETTHRLDAFGNSRIVHIIEIVSKPAAVWPGEQGPAVRDVLAQLKQIVQHMHNLPAGSRFSLGGVLSWVPGIRFLPVPGISGNPNESAGDKIQMIGGKFKSPNTQWTSGIPHLSNLPDFLQSAIGQSTDPNDQVARTFANDGLDFGRRAAQNYFRQYAKGRALPWRENELTGYLAATFPLVGAALHSLVRANLEEGVSKNAVLVAPRKEIADMRSSLPPVLRRFLRDRGFDVKGLIGSYLPNYDPLGNAQARRFIVGDDYLQIALVSVAADNVVFGTTYGDGSAVPPFTLAQLGIGGTDNADPAYINPFELRRLARSNGELPEIEVQTNDLIGMINGYAAAPSLRPDVHQDVTALYNVNNAILTENNQLQTAQAGIRDRVGVLSYPPADEMTQQQNHAALEEALAEARTIVASASENKAFAQEATTAADRAFPVGNVYRNGAGANLAAVQRTLDEARQLVTTLDGMVQNNVVVYQPPYGGYDNQGGGFDGTGGAPNWSGQGPNYGYGGSYQPGPQYGGWPQGGYNQQTWLVQVPDSVPESVGAALALLSGLSELDLRAFADRLRTELTRVRDQAPGDLVGRLPDGVVLDSLAGRSIDSVREQVSTMLAEYDFAAGTGEGPQALPPVGDLVSGVLAGLLPGGNDSDVRGGRTSDTPGLLPAVLAAVHAADDVSIGRLAEGLRALLLQWVPDVEARFGDAAPARWKQFVASVGALDPGKRASVFAAVNAYDFARTAVNRSSNLMLPDVGRVVGAGLGFEGIAGQDPLQVNVVRLPNGDLLYESWQMDNYSELDPLIATERSVLSALINDEDETYVLNRWDRLPSGLGQDEPAGGGSGRRRSSPREPDRYLQELDQSWAGALPGDEVLEQAVWDEKQGKFRRYADRQRALKQGTDIPEGSEKIPRGKPASELTAKELAARQSKAASKQRKREREALPEGAPVPAHLQKQRGRPDSELTPEELRKRQSKAASKQRAKERAALPEGAPVPEHLQRQGGRPASELSAAELVKRQEATANRAKSRARHQVLAAGEELPEALETRWPPDFALSEEQLTARVGRREARARRREQPSASPARPDPAGAARPEPAPELTEQERLKRERKRESNQRGRERAKLLASGVLERDLPPRLQRLDTRGVDRTEEERLKLDRKADSARRAYQRDKIEGAGGVEEDVPAQYQRQASSRKRRPASDSPPERALPERTRPRPHWEPPGREFAPVDPAGFGAPMQPPVFPPVLPSQVLPSNDHDDLYDDPPPRRRGPAPSLPSVTNDFQALSV